MSEVTILFNVKTEHPGKWAIIHSITQVLTFWEEVRFYKTFKRQPFDSVIIKIERDSIFQNSTSLPTCGEKTQ